MKFIFYYVVNIKIVELPVESFSYLRNMGSVKGLSPTGFQFKQFIIHHDQCAMKVCTDSCILGAWFAGKIAPNARVLDIGAGSGLLTLMLAQQADAIFHAIEADELSFLQMAENIKRSSWGNKIHAFYGDANSYPLPGPYDFIICNPPFFENDLKSGDERKNSAKHDTGLTLSNLTRIVNHQLTTFGSFGILLPFHRTHEYEQLASSLGLFPQEKLLIRQTHRHRPFRSLLLFKRHHTPATPTPQLVIKEEGGDYSEAFTALLKPYYLYL